MDWNRPDVLTESCALCSEKKIVLVFDEITSGFRRAWVVHIPLWDLPGRLLIRKALMVTHLVLASESKTSWSQRRKHSSAAPIGRMR